MTQALVKESSTDIFGTVINPGDKVVALVTSRQSAHLFKGKFLGFPEGSERMRIEEEYVAKVKLRDDGTELDYYDKEFEATKGKVDWHKWHAWPDTRVTKIRIRSLQLNRVIKL